MTFRGMRNHLRRRQPSLASLGRCFITLAALLQLLLLNASLPPRRPVLAAAQYAPEQYIIGPSTSTSCYAASTDPPPCRIFHDPNISTAFPFLTSQACGPASNILALSGCDSPASIPTWPSFVHATRSAATPSLGPPTVTAFFNPHPTQLPHQTNPSNVSTDITSPMGPDTQSFGLINLTWSTDLTNKSACQSPVPLTQITHYLPQSIDLTSFAHSAFDFTPSNILLFFNCTSNSSSAILKNNSSACGSYAKACGSQKKANSSCYEYTPAQQKLNLTEAMAGLHCENAMFFVSSSMSHIAASRWSPGLIQLSWSTTAGWIAEQLELCDGCLNSSGVCGYDQSNKFQCYCAGNKVSATDCGKHHHALKCFRSAKCIKTGIAFGAPGFAIALSLALILFCKCYCAGDKVSARSCTPKGPAKMPLRHQLSESSTGWVIRHHQLDRLVERPIEYQYASIAIATNHFSHALGEGSFGVVYKGSLAGADANTDVHMEIAVKVREARCKHSKRQFLSEVAAIGRTHHVHVVRLLGFCTEDDHEMLVYEYVVNGSLDKWLFHHRGRQKLQVLLWDQRYAIAVGVAKGLSYLHEECRHRIVHCDIKPQNILLDKQMCPKIADFGLARLMGREESGVATFARGTPGYIAPEFWMGGEIRLSTKSDVYSYGMVVLELISGQRNFGDGMCFPEMAFEAAIGGDFKSILDVTLGIGKAADDEFDMMLDHSTSRWQQVRTALFVALWCIQDNPMNRPSMSEVVQYLEGIAAINEQPPRPAIASTNSISALERHPAAYLSSDLHYDITPISGAR